MQPNTGVDSLQLIACKNVNIHNLEENNRIHNVQVTVQNYVQRARKDAIHFKGRRQSTDANSRMTNALELIRLDLKTTIVTILNEAKGNRLTGTQNIGNL